MNIKFAPTFTPTMLTTHASSVARPPTCSSLLTRTFRRARAMGHGLGAGVARFFRYISASSDRETGARTLYFH